MEDEIYPDDNALAQLNEDWQEATSHDQQPLPVLLIDYNTPPSFLPF